jgi:hypothetical protein
VAALAGRPAAQFDRRRRHGRGYLAAATLLTVIMALLAVSGGLALAPAAHAACPVKDPDCGPPDPPEPPRPAPKDPAATFSWTLTDPQLDADHNGWIDDTPNE